MIRHPDLRRDFLDGDYDIPTTFTPRVIIEGGANVGYASVRYTNRYPGARIVAVEPELTHFEMLEVNTSSCPNVRRIHAGSWNTRTRLRIKESSFRHSGQWDFQVEEAGDATEGTVCSITIDEALERADGDTIDILELDIVGLEGELFSGAAPAAFLTLDLRSQDTKALIHGPISVYRQSIT